MPEAQEFLSLQKEISPARRAGAKAVGGSFSSRNIGHGTECGGSKNDCRKRHATLYSAHLHANRRRHLDIGNVLLTFDYTVAEQEILKHTGQGAPPSQDDLHPLRMDHETGRIHRADFIKAVREAFATMAPRISSWMSGVGF